MPFGEYNTVSIVHKALFSVNDSGLLFDHFYAQRPLENIINPLVSYICSKTLYSV